MNTTDKQVICFGEILWDVFPDKKVIGGAPLNVAARLRSFGVEAGIISRVGNDPNGEAALQHLSAMGLPLDWIDKHAQLPTGTVSVTLDEHGSASYEINKPVAWDAIAVTSELVAMVRDTPFFLFGSLAVRGAMNRQTLQELLNVTPFAIFDVNLRPPHFDVSMVYELMQYAQCIKLNDEELEEICLRLGCEASGMRSQINWLAAVTGTSTICVTRGADGALLLVDGVFYEHAGFTVKVRDTVGAGDSFLATLINELLLKKTSPDLALSRACAVGSLVASMDGANCPVGWDEVEHIMTQ
ncbi:MAG: carbohydrate kinase [Bacteroidota bacterium]